MQIYDGRESFWQWDLNQKITANGLKVGDEIHCHNMKQSKALVTVAYELNGKVVADVPNILLQNALPLKIYRYISMDDLSFTIEEQTFKVEQRAKPDDYIYEETEILNYTSVVNKALEEAKASGEFNGEKGDKGDPGKDGIDGEDGYTPVRGTDYWTEEDKAEIKSYVDEAILGGAW